MRQGQAACYGDAYFADSYGDDALANLTREIAALGTA